LKVDYLSDLNSKNNIYIPPSTEKNTLLNKAATPDAANGVTGTAPAMLKETENYYNEQIKLAIKNNDIKKAVALYKEAKRLGSPTAEAVLIKGLE
jgi:maltose operon protein